jgi:hypothetical protein
MARFHNQVLFKEKIKPTPKNKNGLDIKQNYRVDIK